ncbi:MAG: site-specific integrase [Bacteroides sp.]
MEIELFVRSLIEKVNQVGRYSTANVYRCAWNSYAQFAKNTALTFEELTPESMKKYEQSLFEKMLKHNSISLYMRMMRSICNQAVEEEVTELSTTKLFVHVFTGNESTRKRAVKPSVIAQLSVAELDEHPLLAYSRDLFMLSFYFQGIPFVDLAYLRKSDVTNGTIVYYRHKTEHKVTIVIERCAQKIIDRYASQCATSIYLLPIITGVGEEGNLQYRSALRVYNKRLNRIAEKLKLGEKLTSYSPRHSWATTARKSGVPTSLISAGMGHASEKMTLVYLDSFEDKTMSEANKKVIAAITKERKKA